mmetsp:Transcript_13593/g.39360  ORF Transcript_13593/g.39360 Transcript_13593/m.39360 type:complete len:512 (-) Transcript_13593:509-2044(-)
MPHAAQRSPARSTQSGGRLEPSHATAGAGGDVCAGRPPQEPSQATAGVGGIGHPSRGARAWHEAGWSVGVCVGGGGGSCSLIPPPLQQTPPCGLGKPRTAGAGSAAVDDPLFAHLLVGPEVDGFFGHRGRRGVAVVVEPQVAQRGARDVRQHLCVRGLCGAQSLLCALGQQRRAQLGVAHYHVAQCSARLAQHRAARRALTQRADERVVGAHRRRLRRNVWLPQHHGREQAQRMLHDVVGRALPTTQRHQQLQRAVLCQQCLDRVRVGELAQRQQHAAGDCAVACMPLERRKHVLHTPAIRKLPADLVIGRKTGHRRQRRAVAVRVLRGGAQRLQQHICSIAVLCQLEGVFERVARLGARVVAVDERGQRRAQRTRERQLLGSFRMCARLRQLRQRLGAKSADEQALLVLFRKRHRGLSRQRKRGAQRRVALSLVHQPHQQLAAVALRKTVTHLRCWQPHRLPSDRQRQQQCCASVWQIIRTHACCIQHRRKALALDGDLAERRDFCCVLC